MQVVLYYTLIKGRNTKSGIYRAGEALRSLGYVHISCQWLCANNKESLRTVWQRKKQSGVLEAMKRRETKKKSILNQFAINLKKCPKHQTFTTVLGRCHGVFAYAMFDSLQIWCRALWPNMSTLVWSVQRTLLQQQTLSPAMFVFREERPSPSNPYKLYCREL